MHRQLELDLDVEIRPTEVRQRRHRSRPASSEGARTSRGEHAYRRNREMIARYYYWTEIRRRRFDDVMRILSDEFHVEERTVSNALLDQGEYLDGLYRKKTEAKELKKEYPSRNWEMA